MRRILSALLAVLTLFALIACDETTTLTTFTDSNTSATSSTTNTIDVANVDVSAFASNNLLAFANIEANISAWNTGSKSTLTVSVDDLVEYQAWGGTGAALTYSSAWLIDQSASRDEIIEYIFSSEGMSVQLIRLCIGASDYVTPAMGHYSYDDTVGNVPDLELEQFSIAKDQVIIDVIKDALEINPDIVFMASPWSAPGWMKTTNSLYGGSLKPAYYEVYAEYLIKFLQAYANEGIIIEYLSVQNEPYYAATEYPGMTWTIDNTRRFVGEFLGPMLETAGLDTKIMIWDHNPVDNNGNIITFPTRVLADTDAANYIDAIGVHCYTGDDSDMYEFLDYLRADAPDIEVFMTECTAITTYKNIESNMEWSVRRMYTEAYNRFAMGTTYWNLVMDPLGATHLGGCTNCTGLVTVPVNGSAGYTLEADAYTTAHFSKYIKLGAKRIDVETNNASLIVTGYRDDTGKITLVIFNDGAERNVTIQWRSQYFLVKLPKSSLSSIVWQRPL
jgi:glucosylceramidase